MTKEKMYSETEVIELMAFQTALHAHREIMGKTELTEKTAKGLFDHLRLFANISLETMQTYAELGAKGQDRIEHVVEKVGLYAMIQSLGA